MVQLPFFFGFFDIFSFIRIGICTKFQSPEERWQDFGVAYA